MIDSQLQQTLTQLKDIHLPSDSLLWPPAPGTSIAFIIITMTIIFIVKKNITALYLRYKSRVKLQALRELKHIEQNIQNQEPILLTQKISLLLKKCAINKFSSAKSQQHIHALSGQSWLEFLDNTYQTKTNIPKAPFSTGPGVLLITLPYQQSLTIEKTAELDHQIKNLIALSKQWIKTNL